MNDKVRKSWWDMFIYPDGIEFFVENRSNLTPLGNIVVGACFGCLAYLFGWLCLVADIIVVCFINAIAVTFTLLAGVLRLLIKRQPGYNQESLREIYWSFYNEMRNDD